MMSSELIENLKQNVSSIPEVIREILGPDTVLSGGVLLRLVTNEFTHGSNTHTTDSSIQKYLDAFNYVKAYKPGAGISKFDYDIYTCEDAGKIIKHFIQAGFECDDLHYHTDEWSLCKKIASHLNGIPYHSDDEDDVVNGDTVESENASEETVEVHSRVIIVSEPESVATVVPTSPVAELSGGDNIVVLRGDVHDESGESEEHEDESEEHDEHDEHDERDDVMGKFEDYVEHLHAYGRYVSKLVKDDVSVDIIFVNERRCFGCDKCKSPQDFITVQFDFSFIKMWYNGATLEFADDDVADDIVNKRFYLDFHPDMTINRYKQIMTVKRIMKYVERGYTFMGFKTKPIREFFDSVSFSNMIQLYRLPNNNVDAHVAAIYAANVERIAYIDRLISVLKYSQIFRGYAYETTKKISKMIRELTRSCYAYKLLKKYSTLPKHHMLDFINEPEKLTSLISTISIINSHEPAIFLGKVLDSIDTKNPNLLSCLTMLHLLTGFGPCKSPPTATELHALVADSSKLRALPKAKPKTESKTGPNTFSYKKYTHSMFMHAEQNIKFRFDQTKIIHKLECLSRGHRVRLACLFRRADEECPKVINNVRHDVTLAEISDEMFNPHIFNELFISTFKTKLSDDITCYEHFDPDVWCDIMKLVMNRGFPYGAEDILLSILSDNALRANICYNTEFMKSVHLSQLKQFSDVDVYVPYYSKISKDMPPYKQYVYSVYMCMLPYFRGDMTVEVDFDENVTRNVVETSTGRKKLDIVTTCSYSIVKGHKLLLGENILVFVICGRNDIPKYTMNIADYIIFNPYERHTDKRYVFTADDIPKVEGLTHIKLRRANCNVERDMVAKFKSYLEQFARSYCTLEDKEYHHSVQSNSVPQPKTSCKLPINHM